MPATLGRWRDTASPNALARLSLTGGLNIPHPGRLSASRTG
jgi:hypothetical protein